MLTERKVWDIINIAVVMNYSYVRVAQLDRASGYGPEGREFESSSARQNRKPAKRRVFLCLVSLDVEMIRAKEQYNGA